jgi:EAL domain-containing protein (putative c-di-GMP-specific phosphodiesterase class I)
MPLPPELIDVFNNRFAQEQKNANYRPLIIENGKVKAVFKTLVLESELMPVRYTYHPDRIAGYTAQILLNPHNKATSSASEFKAVNKNISVTSIVDFDRLCRTVHVLNALTLIKDTDFLVLEVSPRHIIDVKYGHGSYFAKILAECGLQTKNIVISLTIYDTYATDIEKLLVGLQNYRNLGYKIALDIGSLFSKDKVLDLIIDLLPDYVAAKPFCRTHGTVDLYAAQYVYATVGLTNGLFSNLHHLKQIQSMLGGKLILQKVVKKSEALMAQEAGIDLVTGSYYQALAEAFSSIKHNKQTVKSYELSE